jgi:hypothetical protein
MPGKLWSADDDARLLQLRQDMVPSAEIAERFGRSAKACLQRINRMKMQAREAEWARQNGRSPKRRMMAFTDLEAAEVLRLRDELHWTFRSIDKHLGRRPGVCCQRYHHLKATSRRSRDLPRQCAPALQAAVVQPPAPMHRDITAAFFGDPLPGRSALDQRSQST